MTAIASLLVTTSTHAIAPALPPSAGGAALPLAGFLELAQPIADMAATPAVRQPVAAGGTALPDTDALLLDAASVDWIAAAGLVTATPERPVASKPAALASETPRRGRDEAPGLAFEAGDAPDDTVSEMPGAVPDMLPLATAAEGAAVAMPRLEVAVIAAAPVATPQPSYSVMAPATDVAPVIHDTQQRSGSIGHRTHAPHEVAPAPGDAKRTATTLPSRSDAPATSVTSVPLVPGLTPAAPSLAPTAGVVRQSLSAVAPEDVGGRASPQGVTARQHGTGAATTEAAAPSATPLAPLMPPGVTAAVTTAPLQAVIPTSGQPTSEPAAPLARASDAATIVPPRFRSDPGAGIAAPAPAIAPAGTGVMAPITLATDAVVTDATLVPSMESIAPAATAAATWVSVPRARDAAVHATSIVSGFTVAAPVAPALPNAAAPAAALAAAGAREASRSLTGAQPIRRTTTPAAPGLVHSDMPAASGEAEAVTPPPLVMAPVAPATPAVTLTAAPIAPATPGIVAPLAAAPAPTIESEAAPALPIAMPANVRAPGAAPVPSAPAAPAAPLYEPAARAFADAIHRALTEDTAAAPLAGAAPAAIAPAVQAVADVALPAVDMTRAQWPEAVIDRITMLRDMVAEASIARDTSIRLVPDALGAIDVSLRREGDTVHVQLVAEQAQTRAMIEQAQPKLAELAEQRGVKLQHAGTQGSAAQADAGANQQQQQRQPAPQAPQTPRRPASAATATADRPTDERVA